MSTVNLISGSTYVHQLAEMRRSGEYNGTQWSFVVQDCYSGGSLPAELFTREFWQDLTTLVHYDGIVAMVRSRLLHYTILISRTSLVYCIAERQKLYWSRSYPCLSSAEHLATAPTRRVAAKTRQIWYVTDKKLNIQMAKADGQVVLCTVGS